MRIISFIDGKWVSGSKTILYNLPFVCFFNSKLLRQDFSSSKWLKSFIVSAERKSCNSSGFWIIRRSFGSFLNSVVVGKRDAFLIFSVSIIGIGYKSQFNLFHFPFKINFPLKCLIERIEFFAGKQSLRLKYLPISQGDRIFPEEKKMSILFLYWNRTAKCNTFGNHFCKTKYHEKL